MAASVEFELEEFEYVPATAGTALLRVAGRWHAEAERELPPLGLVVRTPVGDDRVEPLPDAARGAPTATPDGAPWRAAFSVAIHVLTSGSATFVLAGDGVELELPAPGERGEEDDDRPQSDRRAVGRELQAANERLVRRVQELEHELESRGEELEPQLRGGPARAAGDAR